MKAIHLKDYGAVENLELVDIDKPVPGPDDVLIKVEYAGLRWGDIMQRNGLPSRARKTPFVPGQEAAGVIEAVGANVRHWKPGMRVMALPTDGAYAEYLLAHPARVWPVPEHAQLAECLAYPVNLRTAYLMVYTWANVQPGETVLLHAAAGGVGLMALQIMKRRLRDVRVIGLCGSDEKAALARAHGADHVINYKTTDYVAAVTEIAGPKASGFGAVGQRGGGVDVSFNGVSGPTLETDPKVIRKRGRWVIYGYSGGRALLNTGLIGYDGITVMPFSSIAWIGTPEYESSGAFVRQWIEDEKLIAPTIYPLEQVAAVQRAMETGQTLGKVVFATAGTR
jgi:NADPH:quinone reductase